MAIKTRVFCLMVACFSFCLIKDLTYARANLESLSKNAIIPQHKDMETKIPVKSLHPARILHESLPSNGMPTEHHQKHQTGGPSKCREKGKATTTVYPESFSYDTKSKTIMSSKPLGVGANTFEGNDYPQGINSKGSVRFQQRAAIVNDDNINPNDIENGGLKK